MQLRPLGKTNLMVSQLSQGGAAFGNQYGPVSSQEVDACVHAAIDAGVNLFDTSPYYGETRAETVLGDCLQRGNLRSRILLCSKAGRNTRDGFDFTPQAMRRSVEASLRRLHTDHLDILIAHDIEFADALEPVFTETAEVLHQLKAEGKCRFVGMSCYPLGVLEQAIRRCNLDVVISYGHFTLQSEQLLTQLLPVADAFGVGVMNASPLALGLLTDQGPPDWHPAPEPMKQLARQAAEHCRGRGATIATLGMQYCLQEPSIPTTITGTARIDELRANLGCLESPPDPALLREVLEILQPVRNHAWASGRHV